MPYFIKDIRDENPENGFRYLFDANIWLAVLDETFEKKELRPYLAFFNSIISEKQAKDASIAVPCLLLSEVINRLINDIYYKEYCLTHPIYPGQTKYQHFKSEYRPSPQYAQDMEEVCSSIRQFHSKIELVSDRLDEYSCKDMIKNIPQHLDINDYLYSKMALQQGLVIVTHDKDFKVEDIHVFTANTDLLTFAQQQQIAAKN